MATMTVATVVESLVRRAAKSFAILVAFGGAALAQEKGWEREWDKVVHAAKQEGRLVFHSGDSGEAWFQEFQKKFPEIKVERMITRGGSAAVQRLMSERRAGVYAADILIIGASSAYVLAGAKVLDPLEPVFILPEVLDKSKWWEGKYHYADKEEKYLLQFGASPQPDVGYNTKIVNPHEIQSLWDLLNPKWKGKIVTLDPAEARGGAGTSFRFMYYHPELGPNFIKRLFGEMDLTASREPRQITDWLAQGKFALSILTSPARTGLDRAKAQGLPVNWFGPAHFKEGVVLSSGANNVALVNRAPHPNAAKLFVNWFLSRDGQTIAQNLAASSGDPIDSLRIDVPKEHVPPEFRRQKGIKYFDTDKPDWMDMTPIVNLVKEVWKK